LKRFLWLVFLLASFAGASARPRPIALAPVPQHSGPRLAALRASVSPPASDDTVYFGGTRWAPDSMRWEALRDSVWTFDTGVGSFLKESGHTYPGVDPYKPDGYHGGMEGWLGIDNTYRGNTIYLTPAWFRRLAASDPRWRGFPCVGSQAGLQGTYSFWAGALPVEAESLCYVAGQGYGNSWDICIQHGFAYPGGAVTLGFKYKNDTEDGFDYTHVYVDTSGAGDNVEVTSYTGTVGGTESRTLTPGIELPFVPKPIVIKFCVVSDAAYSDQDGFNLTACGAFAVDNITLRGAITHTADFETSDNGWTLSSPIAGLGGDWSNLAYVGDLPPIPEPLGSQCAIRDSVLVFFDPATGTHPNHQDNIAISPWIDLERYGMEGRDAYFVDLNGYFYLPLHNYVFVQVNAQWFPDTCSTTGKERISNWTNNGFVYYFGSTPTCNPANQSTRVSFTNVIPPKIREARIAVGVLDYCLFYFNCSGGSNTTPWFDNLRFATHRFSTIQHVIDLASPGDTVMVPPGSYFLPGDVNLNFHGKNIILKSVAGPATTLIDGRGTYRGLVCDQGEDSTAAVIGFTFTNCAAPYDSLGVQQNGGAIYLGSGVSMRFEDCVFTHATASSGGGMFAAHGARPELTRCSFIDNTSVLAGGGGARLGSARLLGCRFEGNQGGGAYSDFGPITARHCVFLGNASLGAAFYGNAAVEACTFTNNHGRGLVLADSGTVVGCQFVDNLGTGLTFSRLSQFSCYSSVQVKNCTISGNQSQFGGGGVDGCGGDIDSCLISGNQSASGAGGMSLTGTRCRRSTIENNTGQDGGGISMVGGVLDSCIIRGNTAGHAGGGVLGSLNNGFGPANPVDIRDCIVTGNKAGLLGGGLSLDQTAVNAPIRLWGATVSGNHAKLGGGIEVGGAVQAHRCVVWGNLADSLGSEVYLGQETFQPDTSSLVTFTCSALDSFGVAGNGRAVYDGLQVFSDPFFCGPGRPQDAPTTNGVYTVAFDSPCLPGKSPCDSLIGALGEGCDVVSVVPGPEPEEPPLLKSPGIRVGPNPFAGALTIDYLASIGAAPRLDIFSVDGRRVTSFQPQSKSGSIIWDGRDASGKRVSPGIYFIRFTAGDLRVVHRVVRISG
jgi:hypothetical protein